MTTTADAAYSLLHPLVYPLQPKEKGHSPTYFALITQKDGTTITKCLNPSNIKRVSSRVSSFTHSHKQIRTPPFYRRLPKYIQFNRGISQLYTLSSSSLFTPKHTQKTYLYDLPTEILIHILIYLDVGTVLTHTSHVSKALNALCQTNALWYSLFSYQFHSPPPPPPHTTPLPSSYYYNLYKSQHHLAVRWQYGKATTRHLNGHTATVYCLAWIDTSHILSGSRDGDILHWDLSSSNYTRHSAHQSSVLCMCYDSQYGLLTGSSDTTCIVWSKELVPIQHLRGHTGGILDVCFVGPWYVSASRDHTLRVWKGESTHYTLSLQSLVYAIAPYGTHQCVSATGEGRLQLWDLTTGQCSRTMTHPFGLSCMRVYGNRIYSGGVDGRLRIWNVETGACLFESSGHPSTIRTLDCLEDKIVSGCHDGTLRVWDKKTGHCLLSFQTGYANCIYSVLLSRSCIISAGKGHQILVLNFSNGLSIVDASSH
ncbi:WD40-repeat-containing domain protein [Spinellus fusiger]|nr:WD40-repeat-containing domain protein [Spinellus fusiger]